MTDSVYVFQQDIKEKKQQVNGARHRKCGSKSKKCSLPSDQLTTKEIKEKSGDVITMNPQVRYNINEFNRFSDELKGIYIGSLQKRFNVGLADIADMFRMKPEAFRNYAMMHSITIRNCIPSDSNLKAFHDWLAGKPVTGTPVEEKTEPEKTGSVWISNEISLDLSGNPQAVADKMIELAKLLNAGEITIKITAIK